MADAALLCELPLFTRPDTFTRNCPFAHTSILLQSGGGPCVSPIDVRSYAEITLALRNNHKAITNNRLSGPVSALFGSRHPVRRVRLLPECFLIHPESSEYSSDLEKELGVAIVADSPSGFHRSKPRIDNECPNDVTRNVGRLGTVRKLVRLADLEGS